MFLKKMQWIVLCVLFYVSQAGYAYDYAPLCPNGGKLYSTDYWTDALGGYWVDHRGFAQCNCTSYAAEMTGIPRNDSLSHAYKWDNRAQELGWPVSERIPIPGSVIQWNEYQGPSANYGHVGAVASVQFNGTKITGLTYTDWNGKGDNRGPGNYTIQPGDADFDEANFIYPPSIEIKGGRYVGFQDKSIKSTCLHDYPIKEYSICWEYRDGRSEVCENANRMHSYRSDKDQGICYTPQEVTHELCPPEETYVGKEFNGDPEVVSYTSPTGIFASIGGFGGGSTSSSPDNALLGPGTLTQPTEPPEPGLPDFVVDEVVFTDGYVYAYNGKIDIHAYMENIGDADWAGDRDDIYVRYYISRGTKARNADGDWVRVGSDEIKKGNLDFGDRKHESMVLDLSNHPGYIQSGEYGNIVVCVDRKEDTGNGDGEVPEKHKSNNCSTEAVFFVKGGETPTTEEPTGETTPFRELPPYEAPPPSQWPEIINMIWN